MQNRRKNPRWDVNLPIVCKIKNRNQEIIISASGKLKNISLGGMKVHLPVRLVLLKSRLIEYSVDLPDPLSDLYGKGLIRWGFWDEDSWETQFGMELHPLEGDPLLDLESLLSDLAQDQRSLILTTFTN